MLATRGNVDKRRGKIKSTQEQKKAGQVSSTGLIYHSKDFTQCKTNPSRSLVKQPVSRLSF